MFKSFATPYDGDFSSLLSHLFSRNARAVLDAVRSALPHEEAGGLGLCQEYSNWIQRPCPELAAAFLGRGRGTKEPSWLQAQVILAAIASGGVLPFEFKASVTKRLVFAGTLLPLGELHFKANGKRLEVACDGDLKTIAYSDIALEGQTPCWTKSLPGRSNLRFGDCSQVRLCSAEWISEWPVTGLTVPTSVDDVSEFSSTLSRCSDILASCAPEYYLWTAMVLREVVPLPRVEGAVLNSRSFSFWPGHVHVMSTDCDVSLINMIVHECSHQYFYALIWATPLALPGAPPAYSALKKVPRPLEIILLSLHAMANIALALDAILDSGNLPPDFDFKEAHAQRKESIEHARQLNDSLIATGTRHLNDVGRALHSTMIARLKAL
jgi:HEXXH motif-containing protein